MNAETIISWWSGGITSAVTCKLCIDLYGLDNVRIIFIDTHNEDEDTYRFKMDCEGWYGKSIDTLSAIGDKYQSIHDVWFKYLSLNVAHGAICSTELKRVVRESFEKENQFRHQAFGFHIDEAKRARALAANYPGSKPIFPLLMYGLTKKNCIDILDESEIEPPRAYKWGFENNNCLKTGCVQGGIGYWQKMQREKPDVFDKMALIEHELTKLKRRPVTMLKDQSKGGGLVFLKAHPDYPEIKDISMMKGRPPKPLMECNGFCGTNDLQPNKTEVEINFAPHDHPNPKTPSPSPAHASEIA